MINSPAATKNTSRKKGIQHTFIIMHQKSICLPSKPSPGRKMAYTPTREKRPYVYFRPGRRQIYLPGKIPAKSRYGAAIIIIIGSFFIFSPLYFLCVPDVWQNTALHGFSVFLQISGCGYAPSGKGYDNGNQVAVINRIKRR